MVSPARKREAVVHLEDKFQVSQRRACKSLGQPRSTQRYVGRQSSKDAVLVVDLRRFANEGGRIGARNHARPLLKMVVAVASSDLKPRPDL